MNDKEKNKNALDVIEKICPNCKRINSEHSEKEFLYCTKKILKDLVLADENRRGMIHNQQNKKILTIHYLR